MYVCVYVCMTFRGMYGEDCIKYVSTVSVVVITHLGAVRSGLAVLW